MRALLVHGWQGYPENAWFPWLRKELEGLGFETHALTLPNPLFPNRDKWIAEVRWGLAYPDTIIIAHSLGVPTTLFALGEYEGPKIEHVVCVAGFARPFKFPGLRQWFGERTIDVDSVREKSARWSVIHATNDPLVPFAEGEWLAEQLGVPIVANRKFHMGLGCRKLPEALEAITSKKIWRVFDATRAFVKKILKAFGPRALS